MAKERLPDLDESLSSDDRMIMSGSIPWETETIDLSTVFSADVTATGSFDMRGAEASSLGKLLNALPIPAMLIDPSHQIVYLNRAVTTADSVRNTILGKSFLNVFPKSVDASRANSLMDSVIAKRKPSTFEAVVHLGPKKLYGRIHLRTLRTKNQKYVLALLEDLTWEKRQLQINEKHEQELRKAHEQLEKRVRERTIELSQINERLLLEIAEREKTEANLRLAAKIIRTSNEAVFIMNPLGRILYVNEAFSRITGYPKKEVVGRNQDFFEWGKHDGRYFKNVWNETSKTGGWQGEVWDRRKNGSLYPKLLSVSVVTGNGAYPTRYVGFFSDISKIKKAQQRLHRLAHFDPLTGLPNRILLRDRLEQAIFHAARDSKFVGVMMLDLDRFKNINDTLGHRFGDSLLIAFSERVKTTLRDSDTVARIGGDEFTVVLPGIANEHGLARVADKILSSLAKPFSLDGREVFVGASIGVAVFPSDGHKAGRLLQNADTALYHAKERGRNHFQFFEAQMNANVLQRLKLEQVLHTAYDQGKFLIHYQPMIDVKTHTIVGMEALLRMYYRDFGVVSAGKLIPVAEETGFIVPIGEWVLRQACVQNKTWQDMGLPPLPVAVNVSPRQLKHHGLVDTVLRILDETGLNPQFLEMELTESVMMEDSVSAIKAFEELKRAGVSISIDDFGTGYSSLAYLSSLPVDKVKIDSSFIRELSSGACEQAIVKAILTVAHSRSLKVVAEGVETVEQLSFLKQSHCDEVQGYLIGRPMPAKDIETQLFNSNRIH